MKIADIKTLIAQQRMTVALEAALALAKQIKDNDVNNSIINLMGRHAGLKRDQREGIITPEYHDMQMARLRYSLQGILDDVPGDPDFNFDAPSVPPDNTVDEPKKEETEKTILFLASNSSESAKLQLDREYRDLSTVLQQTDDRHNYRLYPDHRVSIDSFTKNIREQRPVIVHFAGHGLGEKTSDDTRSGRDEVEQQEEVPSGILVWNEDLNKPILMGPDALYGEFNIAINLRKIPIRLVVLNACYSEVQAEAIAKVVPYVIGTSSAVKDQAALAFARGFYDELANGTSIPIAFEVGINRALSYEEPKERFVLFEKEA